MKTCMDDAAHDDAALIKKKMAVEILLKHKADINAQEGFGRKQNVTKVLEIK